MLCPLLLSPLGKGLFKKVCWPLRCLCFCYNSKKSPIATWPWEALRGFILWLILIAFKSRF